MSVLIMPSCPAHTALQASHTIAYFHTINTLNDEEPSTLLLLILILSIIASTIKQYAFRKSVSATFYVLLGWYV